MQSDMCDIFENDLKVDRIIADLINTNPAITTNRNL